MNFSIDLVEAVWIVLNTTTLFLTLSALADAQADRRAVRKLNGHARELAADGIVRREGLRLVVQGLLLIAVLPGILENPPVWTRFVTIAALMAVPLVLLTSSFMDSRDRKALTIIVAAELFDARTETLSRIESKLDENITITHQASERADKAYYEANSVNEKIAAQGVALVKQGEELAERDDLVAAATAGAIETIDDTHEKVTDLHEALDQPKSAQEGGMPT